MEPVTEPAVDRDALLSGAMARVSVPSGARVSAAVLETGSGDSAVYGDAAFDTASIVKVDILAALLLRAQDAGAGADGGRTGVRHEDDPEQRQRVRDGAVAHDRGRGRPGRGERTLRPERDLGR
ncbi:serine hydrolase [Streptomyces dangxiongensis]|uniref:hypothetical protein n=1 Tax=Streptomyces dangxiongensis TaxID=1442032 RepID=UPI0037435D19